MFHDQRGLAVTASNQEAVDAFDAAVEEFLAQGRDAAKIAARLEAIGPDMVLGHCLRGYFNCFGARPRNAPVALECLAAAKALSGAANDRERLHIEALSAWCAGEIRRANAAWEAILVDHPHDLLAIKLANVMHFYVGDLKPMLHSTARVMPRWSESVPGYGYLLGCRAFSFEENGDPATGEPIGRRAVELNESDIWAGHAVAHCLETMGRRAEGISWITAHAEAWRKRGPFANHLWWHRSLHYLELERYDEVLAAFDTEFWPGPSEDNTDISNASSILMRLAMLGVDVGDRWTSVAEVSAGRVDECVRPFNDLHFIMALAKAGRLGEADQMVANLRELARTKAGTPASAGDVARDAGLPVAEAIVAFARGQYASVVETMMKVRYDMVPLGGSWAQRDVWIRMLINAAMADGQDGLARALLAERVADQPTSAPSWKLYAEALERDGDAAQAETVRAKAASLLAA